MAQDVFKRYEQKYLMNQMQYEQLMERLDAYMKIDEYGKSTICNIYYDTPDFRLIRESLEKPVYKEKLRLRTYGVPGEHSTAFVEIKKKYEGIVYKRRVHMEYGNALDWIGTETNREQKEPAGQRQISHEIEWFLHFYQTLRPAVVLCYDRIAMYGIADHDIRLTVDSDIRWRREQIDLRKGSAGTLLLPDGTYLLEVKVPSRMPAWLIQTLNDLQIYPTSFSKYGRVYQMMLKNKEPKYIIEKNENNGVKNYA